jgi:hypothetical protein
MKLLVCALITLVAASCAKKSNDAGDDGVGGQSTHVTSIASPADGAITGSTLSFSFTSTDAAATFNCTIDSTPIACSLASGAVASGLPNGPHTFAVVATHADASTTSDSVTWTVDTIAPILNVTSPSSLSTTSSGIIYYVVTDASPTWVTAQIDGGAQFAVTSGSTYSGLAPGAHTMIIRATDQVGNQGQVTINFTVL